MLAPRAIRQYLYRISVPASSQASNPPGKVLTQPSFVYQCYAAWLLWLLTAQDSWENGHSMENQVWREGENPDWAA